MANTIKIRRSAVSGKTPAVGDLELGELAVNTYDGKLFTKKSAGGTDSIVEIGAGGGGGASTGPVTELSQVISEDYTLTAGKSGMSVGSIEITNGKIVTVPSGVFWAIL